MKFGFPQENAILMKLKLFSEYIEKTVKTFSHDKVNLLHCNILDFLKFLHGPECV